MNPSIMTRLNYSERFTGIEKRLKTAKCRRAYSLVELMIAMVTGSILITGMTASVLMSQRSLAILTDGQDRIASQRQVLNQLRTDLREATSINMTDPSVWSVVVPDRNNDGVTESIQYRLPTTTSTISRNAWSTETFYPNNNLVHIMRDKPSLPPLSTPPANKQVIIEGVSTNATNDNNNTLIVTCPGTSEIGNLQIAILAAGPNATFIPITTTDGTLPQSNGWQTVHTMDTSSALGTNFIRLGIWIRVMVSNDSNDIVFKVNGNDRLSGCVLRTSGQKAMWHSASRQFTGLSNTPLARSIATTVNNELHFRILAATGRNYTPNFTGLARSNCLALISGPSSPQVVTLGVASEVFATPSPPVNQNFLLTSSSYYITYPFTLQP
jgi:type II secretory pathway pseudopilin PulG